jgi:hypothetical protein
MSVSAHDGRIISIIVLAVAVPCSVQSAGEQADGDAIAPADEG